MRITQQFAGHFAQEWVNAWNTGDIEAIMRHYAEDVRFMSPFLLKNTGQR
ncbi:MAG: nuclear transport factor 2 family protein [Taibaiella sp.]|nr:nuclear transport factor 2 family protein [Taibaiella sp.]